MPARIHNGGRPHGHILDITHGLSLKPFWLKLRFSYTLTMPSQAPVVVRTGNAVVHINDASSLRDVLSAVVRAQPAQQQDITPSLAAHEEALETCRQLFGVTSVGAATSELNRRGLAQLSRRLCAGARGTGALAHPDLTLAASIRNSVCEDLEAAPRGTPEWSPEDLRDDRQLRRPQAASSASKAVKPPSEAAPQGGGRSEIEERMASLEKQICMLAAAQCGMADFFRRRLFQRPDDAEQALRAEAIESSLQLHLEGFQAQLDEISEKVAREHRERESSEKDLDELLRLHLCPGDECNCDSAGERRRGRGADRLYRS